MRVNIQPCNKTPKEITLRKSQNILLIEFDDDNIFEFPAEYLRVYSQSAEAVGHNAEQDTVPLHKEGVGIDDIRQIGNYAIAINFSDGHDTGIYSWDLLYKLGTDYTQLWSAYLHALAANGLERSQH